MIIFCVLGNNGLQFMLNLRQHFFLNWLLHEIIGSLQLGLILQSCFDGRRVLLGQRSLLRVLLFPRLRQ